MGLGALLWVVASEVDAAGDAINLRSRFEDALGQFLPIEGVHIREGVPPVSRTPGDLVTVDLPGASSGRQACLQIEVEQRALLDDWDMQFLNGAAALAALVLEVERARSTAPYGLIRARRDAAAPLIGSSARMRTLRERIERIAGTDFTVLIEGESGSGKELVARQIHELSRRRRGPFIAVNCAALVDTLLEAELFGIEDRTATGVKGRRGKFEAADGGTLFLDEVSDLSPAAQAKLLRAIQDLTVERVGGNATHRVDTRIVVATNRSLAGLVEAGAFRSDLYYRLNGVEVRVAPLRERREDVLELANYFLERHRSVRRLRLSSAAADALLAYEWPGNVRELQRVMERAVALADSSEILVDDLPAPVRSEFAEVLMPALQTGDTMRAWGSRYARLVLERCDNNKRRACRALGISYHTLQSYLRHRPVKPRAKGARWSKVAESRPLEATGQAREGSNGK
jgi:transcriptional regulator with PAS, ATPase and Fis domain